MITPLKRESMLSGGVCFKDVRLYIIITAEFFSKILDKVAMLAFISGNSLSTDSMKL